MTHFSIAFSQLFLMLIAGCLLFTNQAYAGKKQCKTYLDKLYNIQSQQRSGYTAKQGIKLNERAEKARKKWWQCERGLTVTHKKKTKKKKSVKKQYVNKSSNKKATRYISNTNSTKLNSFVTNKPVVIKGKYQGEKQQAWLDYYQQPKACLRPKSTQAFARCLEHKRQQGNLFEQNYLH